MMNREITDTGWLVRIIRKRLTTRLDGRELAALEQRPEGAPVSRLAPESSAPRRSHDNGNHHRKTIMSSTQNDRPLQYRSNLEEISTEMSALYGADVVARELAVRKTHQNANLRFDEHEALSQDPWESARRLQGREFDAVAAAGMQGGMTLLGDSFDLELRRRAQAAAFEKQRVRCAVSIGATVTLRDGSRLAEGEEITEAKIDHPHATEVIAELVRRNVVQAIDPHTAWLRGLDPSIGPYAVARDLELSNGKKLRRGQGCSAADFPALPVARVFADGDLVASMTAGQLRALMAEEIAMRVPGAAPSGPPPISDFIRAIHNGSIEAAPNYKPGSKKGKS